jgi:hypothetical protein
MEQLQNSMVVMLLHTLDERFMQGNHENGENKIVEHMGKILSNVENMKIESHNHDYSSLQYPYNWGFNSIPRNNLIQRLICGNLMVNIL